MNQDEPSVRKVERAIPRDRLFDGGAATQQDGFVGPEQLDVLQRQCPLDVNEKEFVVLGSFCLTSWLGRTNGQATLIFVTRWGGIGYSFRLSQSTGLTTIRATVIKGKIVAIIPQKYHLWRTLKNSLDN